MDWETDLDKLGIQLRSWIPSDKASLIKYANNRAIWRNLRNQFPHPYREKDADEWLQSVACEEKPTQFAIARGTEAIGGIGIMLQGDVFCKSAELGYWLGEPFWGQGIMTAVVNAFSQHVFRRPELEIARIEAGIFGWNTASMQVLKKAGFHQEAVLKDAVYKDGQFTERVIYRMLRSEVV